MALGGGFETILACDLVVASENAVFGLPEPKIGTAAVAGGMHRLVREIGLKPAMELLLTARSIDAEKALRLGLVNQVVPMTEVMDTARAMAKDILQCAPLAVRATKQCALKGLYYPDVEQAQIAQQEGRYECLHAMMQSEDIREGLEAFMEKRKPAWKGR
jgi:crotonobetainyl-CoA hydratase